MNLVPLFEEALEFQDYNGSVLSNGKAAVYYIGRTRLADIYNDVDAEYPAENPRILDNLGMGPVYVNPAFDYELVVFDAYNNELFSVKKYIHSKGEHSTANVVVTPSESIAVSAWTVGDVQVYMPYLTGDVGKVYTGIDPVNVDNVNDTISVSHVGLGLQEPLYFVEDSETACIIGCSAQTEIPSATSGKWEDAADTVIANSAMWAEGAGYEAGSYVDITDNTISVTGLQPSGDYAYNSALATKLDVSAFSDVSGSFLQSADLEGYATESFVNGAVDSAVSGKLDSATYAAQSGNFYLTSNPAGYITGVPSSYLQNSDLTIVDNKITEISGIELSAGDEFPQSATETIEVLTANSGDWNNVSAKLDTTAFSTVSGSFLTAHQALPESATWNTVTSKLDTTAFSTVSGDFLTAHQELPQSATWNTVTNKLDTTAFSTVSGDFITALPADMATTGDINDLAQSISETYQPKGAYLTTADSAEFYTTGNPSGFLTAVPAGYATENWVTSRGYLTAETDWTNTITAASANAYEQATAAIPAPFDPSYISAQVDNKLNSAIYAADSGNFLTAHQSLPQSANWNSTYDTVRDNSGSWTGGIEYTGIDPIVVNNTVHQISANTWSLTIGDGLSAVEDDVNRQTIISVTGIISVETGSI